MTDSSQSLDTFRALALQVTCHAVNQARDRQEVRLLMEKTITRLAEQIAASVAFIGADCRLIVLPEYFLTGFPMGESMEVWANKACLEINGAEYTAFAEIDLVALRRDRHRPGLNNLLSRQRFELYAESYTQSKFYPANTMLTQPIDRKHFIATQQKTIERLSNLGII